MYQCSLGHFPTLTQSTGSKITNILALVEVKSGDVGHLKQPIQACLLTFAVAVFFPAHAEQTVGLFLNTDEAFDGYTLFAPVTFQTTYLIDNEGRLVHSWVTAGQQTLGTYLLDNGNLLRTAAGFVQEYSWNGTLLWEYTSETPGAPIHHDNEPLPNGNVLIITSDSRSAAEAIAAGMDPARVGNGVVVDRVIEVQPVGASGNVVWEWWVWDHLVQDFNPLQENFGVVADNPGLIDINGSFPTGELIRMNAIDYNEELDQILLSARNYGEIWIIDHSTTTEEAAGHSGGASGKGGDLLYRWGNPQVYDRGGPEDQQLFYQHDSRWIDPATSGKS